MQPSCIVPARRVIRALLRGHLSGVGSESFPHCLHQVSIRPRSTGQRGRKTVHHQGTGPPGWVEAPVTAREQVYSLEPLALQLTQVCPFHLFKPRKAKGSPRTTCSSDTSFPSGSPVSAPPEKPRRGVPWPLPEGAQSKTLKPRARASGHPPALSRLQASKQARMRPTVGSRYRQESGSFSLATGPADKKSLGLPRSWPISLRCSGQGCPQSRRL